MRRVELELHDKESIELIIKKCNTLRIGVVVDGMPYIVPLVYGYEWDSEFPHFYMHAGVSGRKRPAFYDGAKVCFEMDIEGPLMETRTRFANNFSREFSSIMGEGILRFAQTEEEKKHFFRYLMQKQTGSSDYDFQPGWLALTNVFMLDVYQMSAAQKGMR